MSNLYIDIRMRLAKQGLFACLPYPEEIETPEASSDGKLEDLHQLRGCVRLFRTVIDRTLLSALSSDKEESEKALRWFTSDKKRIKKDFNTICDLSFLDPTWVKEKALRIHTEFKGKKYFRLQD